MSVALVLRITLAFQELGDSSRKGAKLAKEDKNQNKYRKREREKFSCNSSLTTCDSEPSIFNPDVGTLTCRYACDPSLEGEAMGAEGQGTAAHSLFSAFGSFSL